jgi:hypothetical protein
MRYIAILNKFLGWGIKNVDSGRCCWVGKKTNREFMRGDHALWISTEDGIISLRMTLAIKDFI